MRQTGTRLTLKLGALVFGGSALLLLICPQLFLHLLGIDSTKDMQWAMRMIGVSVFALAGNMWQNANNSSVHGVKIVGQVMFLSAAGLGALTLMIPGEMTLFGYGYAAIGFAFSLSYLINLFRD